jgi:FlaA1/EpsC-like NDP-sugar epimerase
VSDFVSLLRRRRVPLAISFDVTAWIVAYLAFAWLRFDASATSVPWLEVLLVGVGTALVYLIFGRFVWLHQGRAGTASLEEMVLLGAVTMTSGALVFAVNLATQWVPRSVPAGATVATLVLVAWARAAWRRLREREDEGRHDEGAKRVLVIGAGEAGRELLASMLRDPARTWLPVGLLDDDPYKRHRRVRHVPVLGTTDRLVEKVQETRAEAVVIAIPSAPKQVMARLRLAALEAKVDIKILPTTAQLLTDKVGIRDLRDINLSDVLGRNQLDTDVEAIAGYLAGKRVLVTGAGGSIGAELCRQISHYDPARLLMLDRDESALHAVQLSIHGRALLDSDDVILCDIRDAHAVHTVFAKHRPEVVFHAAALKHLPMLEQYPAEAVKTNVLGTRIVLDAADLVGVERFVNISTDKAANPCSVLGYTKRIAERLTSTRAASSAGTFLSVRFGNVLGSRGSVLEAFAKQIAAGGPLTVTDAEVTRYFMTIEEACQLVIQAAAIGSPAEALVLEMGDAVRIDDVARQLIQQSGEPIQIEYTGLRVGEKLHEDLFGDSEPRDIRPRHQHVSHVPVPRLAECDIDALPTSGDSEVVKRALAELCLQRLEETASLA